MKKQFKNKIGLAGLFAVMAIAIAGCATKSPKKSGYVFFPPAPDEPRIQYLTSFGEEGDLGGASKFASFVVGSDRRRKPIWKPYGVMAAKDTLYVCDTEAANVSQVDLANGHMHALRPQGREALQCPMSVAVDTEGTYYVTDSKRMEVLRYSKQGKPLGPVGKGIPMKPCGIALQGERLYVTDLTNQCLLVFSKAKGELLFKLPRNPNDPKERLFQPTNVTLDKEGRIYVCDSGAWRVQIFDADGKYLRSVGEMGLEPGKFARPKGVGVDREHRLYVVDASTQVVQVFDDQGRLLMFFGYPETSGQGALWLPAGLAIDYENVEHFKRYVAPGYQLDHLIEVVNQAGPRKVSVYGFLRKG